MATTLLPIQALTVRASSVNHRTTTTTTDNRRLKTSTSTSTTTNGSWWSPLFGWSADADYIDSNRKEIPLKSEKIQDLEPKPARSKFHPGCFTEEKAKQLRMMTQESYHDVMYHSAIASRLATDFSSHRSSFAAAADVDYDL